MLHNNHSSHGSHSKYNNHNDIIGWDLELFRTISVPDDVENHTSKD